MTKLPKLSQAQIEDVLERYRAAPTDPTLRAAAAAELGALRRAQGKGAKARATLTSSDTDEWNSPREIVDVVAQVGVIGLDPFFNATCHTSPIVGVTKKENSLQRDWSQLVRWARDSRGLSEDPIVYSNPPYSLMDACSDKIVAEARAGIEHVALVKAATETEWFEKLVWTTARAVCFLKGRLAHDEAETGKTGPATFASVLVYHGVRTRRFVAAAGRRGRIVLLNGGV